MGRPATWRSVARAIWLIADTTLSMATTDATESTIRQWALADTSKLTLPLMTTPGFWMGVTMRRGSGLTRVSPSGVIGLRPGF